MGKRSNIDPEHEKQKDKEPINPEHSVVPPSKLPPTEPMQQPSDELPAEEEQVSPETIARSCLDSPGYVLFGAYLTGKKNDQGLPEIQYRYRRYHMTLEDSKMAARAFGEEILKEIYKLADNENPAGI